MNYFLLKEIVSHVMAHFGIIPSNFVDLNKTDSLMSPAYLLDDRIFFEIDGKPYQGKVWGCQLSVGQAQVKVLLGDCADDSRHNGFHDWTMVIQSKDAPIYGLYLSHNLSADPLDSEPDLCVSTNGKEWMNCSTFLQATFLAAMEQVRDLKLPWSKLGDHKDLYHALLSFTNHHQSYGD